MNADGSNINQITYNEGDTQIITPAWRPDGKSIAYAQSDPDGLMDIHVLELSTKRSKQITNSNEGDFLPIWHPNGKRISYTGLYDYTPNLYFAFLALIQSLKGPQCLRSLMRVYFSSLSN